MLCRSALLCAISAVTSPFCAAMSVDISAACPSRSEEISDRSAAIWVSDFLPASTAAARFSCSLARSAWRAVRELSSCLETSWDSWGGGTMFFIKYTDELKIEHLRRRILEEEKDV